MNPVIQPDGSIQIYPVRRNLWLPFLGAIAFVVAGALLIVLRERPAILHLYHAAVGVVSIVFFGACAVVILVRILRPTAALILSREGITDRASPFGVGFLSWDEVDHVSVYVIHGQRTLGVFPKDVHAIMARLGGARAQYMRLNLRMGFAPVNIPQVVIPLPLEEVAELIRARYGVETRPAGG